MQSIHLIILKVFSMMYKKIVVSLSFIVCGSQVLASGERCKDDFVASYKPSAQDRFVKKIKQDLCLKSNQDVIGSRGMYFPKTQDEKIACKNFVEKYKSLEGCEFDVHYELPGSWWDALTGNYRVRFLYDIKNASLSNKLSKEILLQSQKSITLAMARIEKSSNSAASAASLLSQDTKSAFEDIV